MKAFWTILGVIVVLAGAALLYVRSIANKLTFDVKLVSLDLSGVNWNVITPQGATATGVFRIISNNLSVASFLFKTVRVQLHHNGKLLAQTSEVFDLPIMAGTITNKDVPFEMYVNVSTMQTLAGWALQGANVNINYSVSGFLYGIPVSKQGVATLNPYSQLIQQV